MKSVLHFAVAFATLFALTACGLNDKDKSGGDGGAVVANLPQPSNRCMQQGAPNIWQPYQPFGFQSYAGYHDQRGFYYGPIGTHPGNRFPYQNFAYPTHMSHGPSPFSMPHQGINSGFCGCPAGTIPVCDSTGGTGGMGCVQSGLVHNQPYSTWGWDPSGQTWQHAGWGHLHAQNSCYRSVAHACRVGTYDCGMGATCMPTGNGSPRGVCVRH